MEKNILPVLVLYRCQLVNSVAYKTFIQVNLISEFVVYDNSPENFEQDQSRITSSIHYFHDTENGGLSKAYNYGARVAHQLGYKWLLLLDQDTAFPVSAYQYYTDALDEDVLLAPNVVLKNGKPFSPCQSTWKGIKAVTLPPGKHALKEYNVINSGCCIPLHLFMEAGGYKESVRLDFSDFQFQQRLRQVSSDFYILPFSLEQDFSNDETDVVILMKRFLLYLESALQCDDENFKAKYKRNLQVLKHSIALTVRTHSLKFLINYINKYLFR